MLLAFCAALLPIPISSFESPLFQSEPFPCQNKSCGCKTAKHCWTNCCCNTPAQRLAWAKKNKVTPPTYAVLSESTEQHNTLESLRRKVAQSSAKEEFCGTTKKVSSHPCCTLKGDKAANEANLDANAIASNRDDLSVPNASKKPAVERGRFAQNNRKRSLTLSMLAFKCQGKNYAFTQLPWVVPSLRPEVVRSQMEIEDLSLRPVKVLVSIYQQPDTPPPKLLFI